MPQAVQSGLAVPVQRAVQSELAAQAQQAVQSELAAQVQRAVQSELAAQVQQAALPGRVERLVPVVLRARALRPERAFLVVPVQL